MNAIIINFDSTADTAAAYRQLKKQYPKSRVSKANIDCEELEDEWLLALAEGRRRNDSGVRIDHEEMWESLGITQEETDEMEDVELEYELPDQVQPRIQAGH